MTEFRVSPSAVRRLLASVVFAATRARPLTAERAGQVQALATRLGLGFQEVADATRDPRVKKPASRQEAEATYLAAAALLLGSKQDAQALEELAHELDLGLARVELERLAREPGALDALLLDETSGERRKLSAGVKDSKKQTRKAERPEKTDKGEKSARRPGTRSGDRPQADPGSAPPPHLIALAVGTALLVALLIAAAVSVSSGPSGSPTTPTTPTNPMTAQDPPPPPSDADIALAAEHRTAQAGWGRVRGRPRADLDALAAIRATERRVVAAGRGGDAAAKARAKEAAELLDEAEEVWVRSKSQVMRELTEALEQAMQNGDLAAARARLDAAPATLRTEEPAWCRQHADQLERTEAYSREVDAFLARRPAGLEGLREGSALHAEGIEKDVAVAARAHQDLAAWFHTQGACAADVFKAELDLWRAKKPDDARRQRRLLELIVPDLCGFFDRLPADAVVDLLQQVDDAEALSTFTLLVPPRRWVDLPVDGWFPRLLRLAPPAMATLAPRVPAAAWLRLSGPQVFDLLRGLPSLERLEVALEVPPGCWALLDPSQLHVVVEPWPPSVVDVLAGVLDPRLGSAAGPSGSGAPAAADEEAHAWSGTGFYVEPHRVVTNAHVVGLAAEVVVKTSSGDVRGKVLARDARLDLAVVEVSVEGRPLSLAAAAVPRPVFAYGYGSFGGQSDLLLTTAGRVAAIDPTRTSIFFTALVNPGNSGGPLVDGDGRWVGVVNAKSVGSSPAEDSVGIAIHGDTALTWLTAQGVRVTVDKAEVRGETPPDDLVRASVVHIFHEARGR